MQQKALNLSVSLGTEQQRLGKAMLKEGSKSTIRTEIDRSEICFSEMIRSEIRRKVASRIRNRFQRHVSFTVTVTFFLQVLDGETCLFISKGSSSLECKNG